MENKPRLLRITTVPVSLKVLLTGQLSFFRDNGFEVFAASADGPEVQSITSEGIAHTIIPMTRRITPLKDLICLFKLIGLIRRLRPDIVHTHTPKAGLLGMMASWFCSVPVRLHTVAGLPLTEATGLRRTLLVNTERITYFCATALFPNSRGLEEFIRQNLATRTPLKVIGNGSSNGIDTGYFQPTGLLNTQASQIRSQHGIADGDVVFSFVGRIVRDKGIGDLISAFKNMEQESGAKFFLLLIGTFEQDLDPLSDRDLLFLKTSPFVILAGYQNDVRPWLMASDVFVFPSYREGFPNVVMQACCLCVPCIVSNINGCNEIIQDGVTGIIVPPKKPDLLKNAMQKLAGDTQLRFSFSEKAREFVVRHFDRKFVWSELLKAYRELLGKVS